MAACLWLNITEIQKKNANKVSFEVTFSPFKSKTEFIKFISSVYVCLMCGFLSNVVGYLGESLGNTGLATYELEKGTHRSSRHSL